MHKEFKGKLDQKRGHPQIILWGTTLEEEVEAKKDDDFVEEHDQLYIIIVTIPQNLQKIIRNFVQCAHNVDN